MVPRLRFPLAVPLALFAAWTVVAALGSARPLDSLLSSKGLLNLAGLWIVASALGDSLSARRFLTSLAVALGVVAALSIVQVAACPPTPGCRPSTGASGSSGTASGRTGSSAST